MAILSLLLSAVFIGVGAVIGNTKGRVLAGALLGLVFGPPGWLLVAFGPNHRRSHNLNGGQVFYAFAVTNEQAEAEKQRGREPNRDHE
jgi:hypothetical protein